MITRNDYETVKKGIENRILRQGAKMLCLQAQGDFAGALEANQQKIDLLFLLYDFIRNQISVELRNQHDI